MAGIVPGVLLGVVLMIFSYYLSVKRNYPKGTPFSLFGLWTALKKSIWGLGTVLIVVVGVVFGIFTATESAAHCLCLCTDCFYVCLPGNEF